MKTNKRFKKVNSNLVKSKKLHREFTKKIQKEKIPHRGVGILLKKDYTPKFLEVIVKRPERYSCPYLIKQIPKRYKGIKVKIF